MASAAPLLRPLYHKKMPPSTESFPPNSPTNRRAGYPRPAVMVRWVTAGRRDAAPYGFFEGWCHRADVGIGPYGAFNDRRV